MAARPWPDPWETPLLKILLHSNGPANGSGYGQQVALLAPRLKAAGHDVAISCMTGVTGRPTVWEDIYCYPAGYAPFSTDVLPYHAKHFFGGRPGLVLMLFDAWCMDPEATRGLAAAIWTPVHCSPISKGDQAYFAEARTLPVAMSRFGEAQLRAAGLDPRYAPHGVDTTVFRPPAAGERDMTRDALGIPRDAFLVTMVAANKGAKPSRKAFFEAFTAFSQFRLAHPEARLFVHSLINAAGAGFGLDMRPFVTRLGLEGAIHFSDQYAQVTGLFAPEYLSALLGASDVFLNPSMGEGFGIPSVEAQACGTPVILGDNSAQRELAGAGWLVDCQPFWNDDDQSCWQLPFIASITGRLEEAHGRARDPGLRARARDFAERYDVDIVFAEHWKPLLDMLEQYAGAARVTVARNGGSVPLPHVSAGGFRWLQRGDHTDDWISVDHEEFLRPYVDEAVPAGGVVVDVGAHVGDVAVRLAGKASKVIAVEANPDTAAVLRYHLAINDVSNVQVLDVAAWDADVLLNLHDPNGKVAGGSTRVLPGETAEDGTVVAVPLDRRLGGEPRIDLIKLDVEGADLHALRGLAETIARCRPSLIIERHDIYGYYRYRDLLRLLASFGYGWREINIPLRPGLVAAYVAARPLAGGEAPPPLPEVNPRQIAWTAMRAGASQHEGELEEAVAQVAAISPQAVAEIGCDEGGTLYCWRQVCDDVYGITLPGNPAGQGGTGARPLADHGARVLAADSHDEGSVAWLNEQLYASRHEALDVLVIDGDHSAAGVLADVGMYGGLVRPGGLILLHDVRPTKDPRVEVARVWPRLRARYATSEIHLPDGYGWGIIHVREGDQFGKD